MCVVSSRLLSSCYFKHSVLSCCAVLYYSALYHEGLYTINVLYSILSHSIFLTVLNLLCVPVYVCSVLCILLFASLLYERRCTAQFCPILSYPNLSYPILSYPVLSLAPPWYIPTPFTPHYAHQIVNATPFAPHSP